MMILEPLHHNGDKLTTTVRLRGAKNHLLPLAFACLAVPTKIRILNAPTALIDWVSTANCIISTGGKIDYDSDTLHIATQDFYPENLDFNAARKTRYSLLLLGVAAARGKSICIPSPGGCQLSRQHDIHLDGLAALGHMIEEKEGFIRLTPGKRMGCLYILRTPSVGASINLMIAASTSTIPVTLKNISIEPEVCAIADYLRESGSEILEAGHRTVVIFRKATRPRADAVRTVALLPDRIVCFTLLLAGQLLFAPLNIENAAPHLLKAELASLKKLGLKIKLAGRIIKLIPRPLEQLSPINITSGPYPMFASDAQPLLAALAARVKGTSTFKEGVYSDRFQYLRSLRKIATGFSLVDNILTIKGPLIRDNQSDREEILATDLRGGMSACLYALSLGLNVFLLNPEELERGYGPLENFFGPLGVLARRTANDSIPM